MGLWNNNGFSDCLTVVTTFLGDELAILVRLFEVTDEANNLVAARTFLWLERNLFTDHTRNII